ncbi:pentapeptide repeat-containing protein [Myroides guanonis]|uniref:pentapeptide repeat-containing protein n=1 Tax=Myroides guanonis TaxID=1150112 RepID=UPI000B8A0D32|nr:pentapeptide repeat-containing protein [Myroides guanonis]
MRLVQETTFSGIEWAVNKLEIGEFVDCVFENCNFNEADLSRFEFEDCVFKDCNLSMISVVATSFRKVTFEDCKIMGVHFNKIQQFLCDMLFVSSNLSYSVFYELKVKGLQFENCKLLQADFSQSELKSAVFKDTDLSGAVFNATDLSMADFRTAIQFQINPEDNTLNKTLFSKENVLGLVKHLPIKIE